MARWRAKRSSEMPGRRAAGQLSVIAFGGWSMLAAVPALGQTEVPNPAAAEPVAMPQSVQADAVSARLREAIDKIKQRLAERKASAPQAGSPDAELTAAQAQIASLRDEVDRLRSERDDPEALARRQRLAVAEQRAMDLEQEVGDARVEVASLKEALAAADASRAILQDELAAVRAELRALTETLIAREQLVAPEADEAGGPAAGENPWRSSRRLAIGGESAEGAERPATLGPASLAPAE